MNNQIKAWRLVISKPRAEKKVCDLLTKKNIEYYCPVNRTYRQRQDRHQILSEPLFQRYVFIKIADNEVNMVNHLDGVQHFVYWLGKPATIKGTEIDIIRNFTNEYTNVQLEKIEVDAQKNATTLYVDHQQENLEGQLKLMKYCKALLPSLGFALVAEIVPVNVEILKVRRNDKFAFSNFFTGSFR